MSLRSEQYNAMIRTREFLRDLMDPAITKRVPKEIRERAYRCIRHYPHCDSNGIPRFSIDPYGPDEPPVRSAAD